MFAGDIGIGGHYQTTIADLAGDAAQVAIFGLNPEENIRVVFGLVTAATGLAVYLGARCACGDNVIAATGGKGGDEEEDKRAFFQCAGFHD